VRAPAAPTGLLCLLAAGAASGAPAQTAPAQPAATTQPAVTVPPAAQPAQPAARAGAPAPGAIRYVIEQLVVNVNSAADGSGTRVATLKSEDKVELLERSGEAAHIRLANGRDGWVRTSYLSEAEPLRVQLAARTAEVATLRQQLQALSAASHPAAATATAAPAAGAAGPGPERVSDADAGEDTSESRGVAPGWLIGTALVSLGAGFAVGWLVLDARIRRRYGGLRIY
jgi:Bacterial SH3 domain